jgi:hypothetical protein
MYNVVTGIFKEWYSWKKEYVQGVEHLNHLLKSFSGSVNRVSP